MIRSPRVWLYAAGLWLVCAALVHVGLHVWTLVLENGMVGLREFAMNAMKQAASPDPLTPSLWRAHRMLSASFGFFLFFAGAIDLIAASIDAPTRVLRALTLFGSVFWTLVFLQVAFVDPVLLPILVAMIAVPLHAIAYVTAANQGPPRP